MKNQTIYRRIPILFAAVCIALILLMVFQINWLLTSREMIREQFDQKVELVIGNALSSHNKTYTHDLTLSESHCCSDDKSCYTLDGNTGFIPRSERKALEKSISSSMACYGIEDEYHLALICSNNIKKSPKSYSCSLYPSTKHSETGVQLTVTFPYRNKYVFDKLKFMLVSSILIFLLLATVSFIILNALIQQKRITENNIDFFNNTAHELKTPLTNISLALNLFNRKNESVQGQQYLKIIERESSKLSKQIERVLHLSKMESGDDHLRLEEIDLKTVVTEAVDYMDMIRAKKDGKIQLDLPETPCIIKSDRFHLTNICINLLDNALKYCEEPPQIKISLKKHDNYYKLTFSDKGIGISKYDLEHIFEKFQRVNTGDVQDTKGFGIGLSYVKTALEMLNGFIKVHSELHKGTQFEISLPSV